MAIRPVRIQCPCGQKLSLNISEKHLGKTLEATCSSCAKKSKVKIPEVIHDGTPPQKKEDRYDYDPLAGRTIDAFPSGSMDDFINIWKGDDFPFFGKK